MAGIPSMNSLHSLYNFFDPPWVLAQLSRIQGRIGKEQFPTVATTMLPNATSLRRYRKRPPNACPKRHALLPIFILQTIFDRVSHALDIL